MPVELAKIITSRNHPSRRMLNAMGISCLLVATTAILKCHQLVVSPMLVKELISTFDLEPWVIIYVNLSTVILVN